MSLGTGHVSEQRVAVLKNLWLCHMAQKSSWSDIVSQVILQIMAVVCLLTNGEDTGQNTEE